MDGQVSPASVGLKESEGRKSSGKKRKVEYQCSNPSIYKLQKTEKENESVQVLHTVVRNPSEVSKDKSQPGDTGNDDQEDSYDLKLTSDDIGKFIAMWKETCREHTVGEVCPLSSNMHFYIPFHCLLYLENHGCTSFDRPFSFGNEIHYKRMGSLLIFIKL